MMRLKRFIAAAAALLISGTVAFSAIAKELGTAGVYSADVYWDVQFWGGAADDKGNMNIASVTNAKITGDGVYTASVKFAYPLSYGQYFALGTSFKGGGKDKDSSFADYPDARIKILKVKADGVEIKGSDVPDVNVEGFMRVYIYNPWTDDALNYAEDLDWTAGITEIEVTFEITGLEKAAVTTSATTVTEKETEPAVTTVTEKETEPVVTTVTEKETEPAATTVTEKKTEPVVTTVTEKETEPVVTTVTEKETEPAVITVTERETEPEVTTVTEKETEPEVTTVTERETEPVVTTATEKETESAETTEGDVLDETATPPAADDKTSSADTGNTGSGVFAAASVLSAMTAILSRKKRN